LYPFMLVINESFESFDPRANEWTIIWLSDFCDNPNSISEIFGTLMRKVRQEENLFDYFKNLSTKKRIKKFMDRIEIKPGLFGFSIDVKAMLLDLGKLDSPV